MVLVIVLGVIALNVIGGLILLAHHGLERRARRRALCDVQQRPENRLRRVA